MYCDLYDKVTRQKTKCIGCLFAKKSKEESELFYIHQIIRSKRMTKKVAATAKNETCAAANV